MKLVTIICEALAREHLLALFAEVGVHGYTLFPVEGAGSQGRRPGDIAEFGNIQVEVVAAPALATVLMERLQAEFFPRFALIVYESDVRVLRPSKF